MIVFVDYSAITVWQTDAHPSENHQKTRQASRSFPMLGKQLTCILHTWLRFHLGFLYFQPGSRQIPQHQQCLIHWYPMVPRVALEWFVIRRRQGLQADAAHLEEHLYGRWLFDDYWCCAATDLPVSHCQRRANLRSGWHSRATCRYRVNWARLGFRLSFSMNVWSLSLQHSSTGTPRVLEHVSAAAAIFESVIRLHQVRFSAGHDLAGIGHCAWWLCQERVGGLLVDAINLQAGLVCCWATF